MALAPLPHPCPAICHSPEASCLALKLEALIEGRMASLCLFWQKKPKTKLKKRKNQWKEKKSFWTLFNFSAHHCGVGGLNTGRSIKQIINSHTRKTLAILRCSYIEIFKMKIRYWAADNLLCACEMWCRDGSVSYTRNSGERKQKSREVRKKELRKHLKIYILFLLKIIWDLFQNLSQLEQMSGSSWCPLEWTAVKDKKTDPWVICNQDRK